MTDIDKALFLSGERTFKYEVIVVNNYFRVKPESAIYNMIEVLKKVGLSIMTGNPESKKYEDTIFYNIILLPLYDDIINPT